MKSMIMFLTICLMAISGANAASSDTRGMSYQANEAMRVQNVLIGTVEDMRMVEIDQRNTWSQAAGTGIGATLGGLAGNEFGKGKGKTAMTVVMAAFGGGVGNEVEKIMNTAQGIEFIVTLNDGRTVAVAQALDNDASQIAPGDRVRIVQGQNTRVVKLRSQMSQQSQQQSTQQLQKQLQQIQEQLQRAQSQQQ